MVTDQAACTPLLRIVCRPTATGSLHFCRCPQPTLLPLLQVESDYSLANFGFFLSAWDAQTALDQDLLAGKCLLADQEHKLFTFADRKVRVCGVWWCLAKGRGGCQALAGGLQWLCTHQHFQLYAASWKVDGWCGGL
jgi:hypothetical protein